MFVQVSNTYKLFYTTKLAFQTFYTKPALIYWKVALTSRGACVVIRHDLKKSFSFSRNELRIFNTNNRNSMRIQNRPQRFMS